RSRLPRVTDSPLRPPAHTLREPGIVHIGIVLRGSNMDAVPAAIPAVGDALYTHDLLVIRAIVMHDHQDRDATMSRRPQLAVGDHEIPVRLNGNREPAVFL